MGNNKRYKSYELTEIAIFVVILVLCSWISIPTVIPFTLQTFAIFLAICVLGGKKTTMIVFLYLLMGCIGIPVFSGFGGGFGYVVGNTGGFLTGFLIASIFSWGIEKIFGIKTWVQWLQMFVSTSICYVLGVIWYVYMIQVDFSVETMIPIISIYVVPYVIPDGIKMCAAYMIGKRLKKVMKNISC